MKFMEEKPQRLLNVDNNAKTVKGQKQGYLTGILYLYPYKAFGMNICANAENADCFGPCLNTAGRGQFNSIQEARLRKTYLFHQEREWFMMKLFREIEALERKAMREKLRPAVRLNGTSDIDWEAIEYKGQSLMEAFPRVQFYDYTKLPRVAKNTNYHLTFSYSEAPAFQKSVRKAERLGMNMTVVSLDAPPTKWRGRPVIDGDANDLRFLDPDNCIIWLRAKGKAKKMDTQLIAKAS